MLILPATTRIGSPAMLAEKMQTPLRGGRHGTGFSLVEVLIALIIMSVGMLGIAGLYVHSMQAGRTSLFRHHAVMLAGDVADRIRANPLGGAAYEGAGNKICAVGGADCTAADMAANDVALWLEQAAASLPDGTVAVVYNDALVPSTYSVTVRWSEAGYDVDPTYVVTFPVFEMP
jgi:type IV pilus assembly protein PilV